MTEREQFEAWARTCDGNCNDRDLERRTDGDYHNMLVQRDWDVWQARATVAPAVDAQPVAIYQTRWSHPETVWGDVTKDVYDRYETFGYVERRTVYASAQSEGLRKDAVPDGVEVASYRLADDPDMTVQRIGQVTGPDLWAVRYGGNCLGKDGEWEYEPMPSSRDADFLARCRFASAQEAIDAAIRALSQKESQ